MFDLLKKLVKPFGVSGEEGEIASVIEREIAEYTDSVTKDSLGNLIAVKRTGNTDCPEKIMLAAHMDTIGIISSHIDEKGFIRFSNIGGLKPKNCIGHVVEFSTGIKAVISCEESAVEAKDIKISSLYADAGFESAEEAGKKVPVGTPGRFIFASYIQGDRIVSGYLDDRAGCAVLIETAKRVFNDVKTGDFTEDKEIYYVFTVQEELGLRGAGPAAFSVNPDIAVAVDVTCAGDTPGTKDKAIILGGGPVIKIKDAKIISHPYIKDRLKEAAENMDIPVQYEIESKGGTDAGAIHTSAGGVVTGGISIAARYIHTPAESCSLKDLKNVCNVLNSFLKVKI